MVRCIVRPNQIHRDVVTFDSRQGRHLTTVLRLRAGDELIVMTGHGPPQVAVMEPPRGRVVTARLVRPASLPPSEPWRLTIAAAIPRRAGAFDQIVDEATQLGVFALVPLVTARSVVRLEPARADARHRRWSQLAVEASQQSGRGTVPTVSAVTLWDDLLRQFPAYELVLLPTPQARPGPLAPLLRAAHPARLLVLIGPEGDFTGEEVTAAEAAGARLISLGPGILRCETAAVAAAAVVLQALREAAAGPG